MGKRMCRLSLVQARGESKINPLCVSVRVARGESTKTSSTKCSISSTCMKRKEMWKQAKVVTWVQLSPTHSILFSPEKYVCRLKTGNLPGHMFPTEILYYFPENSLKFKHSPKINRFQWHFSLILPWSETKLCFRSAFQLYRKMYELWNY